MTPRIVIRDLRVRFGDRQVLNGVNIDVEHGEWVNIVGPNGAGKTTLLRSLLGAVRYLGVVRIDGISGTGPAERARNVAYVPQSPVIPAAMSVIDFVLLGRTPHRSMFAADKPEDLTVARQVLDRLDLVGFSARRVDSLSGGERQRAVLARALAQQAPILLLDEPTTALDLGHQQAVLNLVDQLRQERSLTVVATMHDLTLAARYGHRVALLSEGEISADGSPREVLTEASIRYRFGAEVEVIDYAGGPVIVPLGNFAADRLNQRVLSAERNALQSDPVAGP